MEFKDYYATLAVAPTASADEIKRAYRKLARKFHPDVSKEPDAEARFKEVAEAYEALGDAERRAAYDAAGEKLRSGDAVPPDWGSGFEFSGSDAGGSADFGSFFESLFGRRGGPATGVGRDHHARIVIALQDAYRGARRTLALRVPVVDAQGHATLAERQLDVNIPPGVREGQHLRLAGQGAPGHGGEPAGDLYLEIAFAPHPLFRVDGRDVHLDLPVAPWEAALGASIHVPTPDGGVQLTVAAGSPAGRKLRLRGKGLPGSPPGDLYAVLTVAVPPATTAAQTDAYAALAAAFSGTDPRAAMEAQR